MSKRIQLLGFLLYSLVPTKCLEVEFAADHRSYYVINDGKTLFAAEGGVAVFCEGKWQTQADESLQILRSTSAMGFDTGLGNYSATEITWQAGQTLFVTTTKNYHSGTDVVFEYSFPNGAEQTSTVAHAGSDRDQVIVNFPTFTTTSLPNSLSWEGSFVGAKQNQYSTGPTGGPTVFYDSSDKDLSTVLVGSALNNFKATSAGPSKTWNGTSADWAPGNPGTIASLPEGWTQAFLLHLGSDKGITSAIGEWGTTLQAVHQTHKVPDVTLSKIGYQTDNGAFYVFCRTANCSETLLDVVGDLKAMGVPMGYLSFQGAGASSLSSTSTTSSPSLNSLDPPHAAPWCVNTWGVDGGLSPEYPMDLESFQAALGIPLQLYAPYFCPGSDYFNSTSQWTSVKSNTSLEGCGFYGFQDVAPDESRAFYDWFFAKGSAVGMASFEPDFMNQNYNCVPEFIHSATNATIWQHGMADAALAGGVAVQWCYAAPTDVLASLTMPAVTNFRVSNDFCYGQSWDIGVSSLIVWAVGAAPSKDTLWSTDNGKFAVPGCNWTPDHEAPAAELHVILALMSTGPVGLSDGLGFTDASLLQRTIRSDGVLLKPSKPITSVDSALAAGTGTLSNTLDANARSMVTGGLTPPSGFVYSTYSGLSASLPTQAIHTSSEIMVSAYYFVSFKMKSGWSLNSNDFYPPTNRQLSQHVFRRFDGGHGCINGTNAATCVNTLVQGEQLLSGITIPASDMSNVTGGTDFSPVVTTVWPMCENSGWVLLGDLTKYVAVSEVRFTKITCTATGVSYTVQGVPGEVVSVWMLRPTKTSAVPGVNAPIDSAVLSEYTVLVQKINIHSTGWSKIEF